MAGTDRQTYNMKFIFVAICICTTASVGDQVKSSLRRVGYVPGSQELVCAEWHLDLIWLQLCDKVPDLDQAERRCLPTLWIHLMQQPPHALTESSGSGVKAGKSIEMNTAPVQVKDNYSL
eukprot:1411289-Amphidinium_carterae.1